MVTGIPGQSPREIQAIRVRLVSPRPGMRVCYAALVAQDGWQPEVCDGALAGTTGQSKSMQALRVRVVLGPGPVLSLVNPDATLERGLCVTAAVPKDAASECGDLRLAHALPSVRTMGRARAPVLLYNSQHANPFPVVAANLALDPAQGTPERVTAALSLDGRGGRGTQTWSGWAGGTRRLAYAFDGQDLPTGVYPYTLEVSAWYGGVARTVQARGELAVVNRARSPYGAGWWIAGLEQLHPLADGRKLWVGGDGSTRVYTRANDTTWAALSLDGPDTLRYRPAGDGRVERYVRLLPGGVRVIFGPTGYQDSTVNRLGHVTAFGYYMDSPIRVQFIQVPGGAAYSFSYGKVDPWPWRLWGVALESGGQRREALLFPHNGDPRVWTIRDADGSETDHAYVDTGPTPERVLRRRDGRRVSWADFTYGAAGTLARAGLDMGVPGEADDIVVRLAHAETRGLATEGAALPDSAFTLLDGPREDVDDRTRIWTGRLGAPARLRDALGNETTLTRGDARYPALATRVDYPARPGGARRTVSASYDARGNLEASTDWSHSRTREGVLAYATTRYERGDPRWPDFVTRSVSPEGEVATTGYGAGGDREWEQTGTDPTRRVTYEYHARGDASAPGMVRAVVTPSPRPGGATARTEIAYDSRGNLASVTTPVGTRTRYHADAFGQDTLVASPVDTTGAVAATRNVHDGAGRVRRSETTGPAMNGAGAQTVIVETAYDLDGNPVRVTRKISPDPQGLDSLVTEWRHDAMGRVRAEVAPHPPLAPGAAEPRDSTVYDKAGNVAEVHGRRGGAPVQMTYDALGRISTRVVPSVTYPKRLPPVDPSRRWPLWGNTNAGYPVLSGGLVIPADTARFAYDETGNLVAADNRDARIRRGYHPDGRLGGDTLAIRTVAELAQGGNFSDHVHGLEFQYDLEGRRTELKHPLNVAPAAGQDRVRYAYDPETGALESIRDIVGNVFRFGYGRAGDLDTISRPGARVVETFARDDEGRLAQHLVTARGTPVRSSTFGYDVRGKVTRHANTVSPNDRFTATYSGLGYLVSSSLQLTGTDRYTGADVTDASSETFVLDALGNVLQDSTRANRRSARGNGSVSSATNALRVLRYEPGTGRLVRGDHGTYVDTTFHDAAGNVEMSLSVTRFPGAVPPQEPMREQASFYRADGALHASDVRWVDNAYQLRSRNGYTAEEYRYDALGRRVWVRMRQGCDETSYPSDCSLSTVRRTVWDGDEELYEIQMPGQQGSAHLERDTGLPGLPRRGDYRDHNPYFGRVAYTHGPGLDQPLSVIRMNYGQLAGDTYLTWPTLSILPLWDHRGRADQGVFGDGDGRACVPHAPAPDGQVCLYLAWPKLWHAYGQPATIPGTWQGTVLEDKRDGAGTLYRRNRYYDPATGRFTQEDPIGLAGGLNLYGFAGGDPVSYSDPYGLSPRCDPWPQCIGEEWAAIGRAALANVRAMMEIENTSEERQRGNLQAAHFVAFAAAGMLGGPPMGRANPLAGTRYTGKVRQQMRPRNVARQDGEGRTVWEAETDNHGFPLAVDNMARHATTRTITGGDGIRRTLVELRGHYKGRNGTFEWIVEPDRTVNHRYFRVDP